VCSSQAARWCSHRASLSRRRPSERELIGPDNEIEIYHLNYVADGNKILFDGLRFSDNQYVIGEYDLTTNQLSVVSAGSTKWAGLQSFGS